MRDIQLLKVEVHGCRVEYSFRTSEDLKAYFTEDKMWIEYAVPVETVPKSILAIPFVANVLPIVWMTDSVLWIEKLDYTFYHALLRLKTAYQELYPQVKLGGRVVSAKVLHNSMDIQRESLLLFSGGIDAHVSYLRIKDTKPVLVNIQGWYRNGQPETKDEAAEADRKDISNFAKEQQLDFEFVKSNFAVFINAAVFNHQFAKKLHDSLWHGFQHSMNFISIAIPIAYINGAKNIYIASSFNLGHIGKCASYPTTDIEFKFATQGGCVHDAFELSRQDKVRYLVEYQKKSGKPYPVRVCSFNDHNCCECDKCFRTVLEIVAENGEVSNFGFDIPGNLKDYYADVMNRKIVQFGIEGESQKHWPDTKRRMKENYDSLNPEPKEFVDWFLNYDFVGTRKKALRQYYKTNFFKILKRKLFRK